MKKKIFKHNDKVSNKTRMRFYSTDFVLGLNFSDPKHPLNECYRKTISQKKREARHDFV